MPESNRAYLRYWLGAKALEVAVGSVQAAQMLEPHAKHILVTTNANLAKTIQDIRPMGRERMHTLSAGTSARRRSARSFGLA